NPILLLIKGVFHFAFFSANTLHIHRPRCVTFDDERMCVHLSISLVSQVLMGFKDLQDVVDDLSKKQKDALDSDPDLEKLISTLVKDVTPHDYQIHGVKWLIINHKLGLSSLLGDEMGLGKTLQLITFLTYLKHTGNKGPFLVTCPLATLDNWRSEFARF